MKYRLIAQELDEDDMWVGDVVSLAVVTDNKARGKLAGIVNEILQMDGVRLGLAGEFIKMTGQPWLVGYALTMRNGDLIKSKIPTSGYVRAVTMDGEEIPMPKRYAANLIDDDLPPLEEIELAELQDKTISALLIKASRNVIQDALDRLAGIPRVDNKHIAVPWPVAERPKLEPEQWAESVIESVMLENLYASQQLLNANRVEYYVKYPGAIEEGRRAFANVYDTNGRLVIVDGHHRLAALWLLGADMANVWYLENDADR
jgi:hypothetical protein